MDWRLFIFDVVRVLVSFLDTFRCCVAASLTFDRMFVLIHGSFFQKIIKNKKKKRSNVGVIHLLKTIFITFGILVANNVIQYPKQCRERVCVSSTILMISLMINYIRGIEFCNPSILMVKLDNSYNITK